MLPSNACDKLMGLLEVYPEVEAKLREKMLFVVPAFEFRPAKSNPFRSGAVPNDTAHVLDLIASGDAQPFHNDSAPGGHGMTDFPQWLQIAEKNAKRRLSHSLRVLTSYGDWQYSDPILRRALQIFFGALRHGPSSNGATLRRRIPTVGLRSLLVAQGDEVLWASVLGAHRPLCLPPEPRALERGRTRPDPRGVRAQTPGVGMHVLKVSICVSSKPVFGLGKWCMQLNTNNV